MVDPGCSDDEMSSLPGCSVESPYGMTIYSSNDRDTVNLIRSVSHWSLDNAEWTVLLAQNGSSSPRQSAAPNSVANNLGASNFPYSGPSPDGCAIGVLQNLYAADGAQVPSVQTIQNAVANYWSKIDPGDPSNPTASQVGVTSGVFFGTLSGAVNGSLSSYGYTATQQNFNTSDPATLQTLVTTYGAVGITITVTLPDGTTANHAVMYNGQNMYTAYPTTATGNATAIPTSPAQMAGMANSSFVLVLVPIKPH